MNFRPSKFNPYTEIKGRTTHSPISKSPLSQEELFHHRWEDYQNKYRKFIVQKKALRGDRNNEGPILKDRMN